MVIRPCVVLLLALGSAGAWTFAARPVSYETIDEALDLGRVRKNVEYFASLGSRVSGYPGNEAAAEYILARFKALGLETYVQEFDMPTPLDEGCTLEVGGKQFEVGALWPNLVRTCQVPPEGLTGPLIYVGKGDLTDFDGKPVENAIVLMDFNTGQNWLNAPLLGAAAVVFLQPPTTTRGEAETKFLQCPVSVPRFYARGDAVAQLLALAASGTPAATIRSRVSWVNRTNRNILGILRGADAELSKEALIFSAFYDSISVVPRWAPGAESASGIAALLELARLYSAHRPARSIVFLATSGHFEALAGAREFVRLWGQEPRRERERNKRLRQLERALADLQADKTAIDRELAALARKEADLRSRGMSLPAHERVIHIGQLELTPEQGRQRKARDDRDIARLRSYIEIWNRLNQFDRIHLFVGLDLSSHSPQLGIFSCGWYFNQSHLLRFYSPLGKSMADWAEQAAEQLGLDASRCFADGINPIKGREWYTFFPGKVAFDHEMMIRGGRPGVTLATANDSRNLVDTPLDTPDQMDWEALGQQVRLSACLLYEMANAPDLRQEALKRVEALKKMCDLIDVRGSVLEFRRRQSFVPNTPVPHALVIVQGTSRIMMGVHTTVLAMANESSEFELAGEMQSMSGLLEAYRFDETGRIIYAPDRGADGDKKYPRDVYGRAGLRRPVIVFPCVATDIYDLVDERYFQTLRQLYVYDARDYAEPMSFGYSLGKTGVQSEFPSYVEPCAVIYSQPDVQLQVTMSMGLLGVRLVLINATEKRPTGEGFPAAETPTIAMTSLKVASDMWLLDESRLEKLRRNGIRNRRLDELHDAARASLDAAREALQARQYSRAVAAARHAWGYESRAYPDVQRTAIDVIKGVLFYLALLLPFAFFAERLFIHSRTVIGLILGTVGMFLVVFIALYFVHPAFALTTAPPIILLSFIIMALAVLVIAIVTAKFNAELKQMKQARGGVHEADVGRLSALSAAFNLGVANMRRRKTRTGLTAATIVLLTFTVLSFSSVKSYLRLNQVRLTRPPAYQGVLLRDRGWLSLEEPTTYIVENEYGRTATIAPRAWFISSDLRKELTIDVASAADPTKTYSVNVLLGLTPQERHVMPVQEALVAGRWLESGERHSAVIPESAAAALGIGPQNIGSAEIRLFGTRYRVVGILDESRFRNLQDLDGETMTPVNYSMLRPEILKQIEEMAKQREQLGTSTAGSLLQEYVHYAPDRCIVLPYERVLELGGTLRSIAVRFADGQAAAEAVGRMMKRFALTIYAGLGRDTYLFSSVGMTALTGLENLIIPIVIAALIVLNTMLGAVHERVKEIGIYSSLGLAPAHVSMLFLAEAAVFANLGAIVGYLMGQTLAKILATTGHLAGLELNYSSTSAVAVTALVVAIVLLSTVYPSRRASQIAAPAMERKWSLPQPEGDVMVLRLPFTVTGRDAWGVAEFMREFFEEYVGFAGGEFVADDVRVESLLTDRGEGVAVRLRMWLAPYDLGVSQNFEMTCTPTPDEDIYEITIRLERLSGDMTSWRKTNTLFMASIRKQFLIWRTVPVGEKAAYADRAEELLKGAKSLA
ncbi:MAG: M28 family peptidase [Armatimonadetes bacterium]|nr:M28 family peptidase [Armatimonadota bacterium]